jgi:hypothetical protein
MHPHDAGAIAMQKPHSLGETAKATVALGETPLLCGAIARIKLREY